MKKPLLVTGLLRTLGLLAALAAGPLAAQEGCGEPEVAARRWEAPLDRPVSLHARVLSLRDALDRLAAAARIRLSYSGELLPLDRRVCVSADSLAVGDLLSALLRGTSVEPVNAGGNHVVLAPARVPPGGTVATLDQVVPLDRIVVTGSATGAPLRSLPVALSVLRSPELSGAESGTLPRALNSSVPGVWAWEHSPATLVNRYASIRGASSFGMSYPKTFIDGIEVANPLLVSHIIPESIERVEVIRGPQGAALYGTDAISGVINIVTRHGGSEGGAPQLRLRTDVGLAESDFAPGSALAQSHALGLRAGSGRLSGGLNVAGGSVGELVPEGYSRHLLTSGNARLVRSRAIVTGMVRLFAEQAGIPANPLLASSLRARQDSVARAAVTGSQSVRQYTAGVNASFMQSERWTYSALIGIDGDRLDRVQDEQTPFLAGAESASRAATGGADRGSLRLSGVGRFRRGDDLTGTVTLTAEHSVLRETAALETVLPGGRPDPTRPAGVIPTRWRENSGVVAQATGSYRDQLHLTGGVRVERNEGHVARSQYATLPMLGAALVQERGDLTVKLRAAYGKGIRPARTGTRETVWAGTHTHVGEADLDPEEQAGVEGGIDLFLGSVLTLQATRFDQLASGLIQRVALAESFAGPARPAPGGGPGGSSGGRRVRYALQNVGEISNQGWELEATGAVGRLSLGGTLSLVDSRVRKLAHGYGGDLRPGDRILEVPARTASLSATWSATAWSASLTAYRAADWINYDRLTLSHDYYMGAQPPRDQIGSWLRGYWREYEGVTHLNASTTLDLRRDLSVVITGDNLLNRQIGEPDNATVLPGRTFSLGFRAEL